MTQKKSAVATTKTVKKAVGALKLNAPARRFVVKYSLGNSNWYWHALAKNGKVTFQGEGHPTSRKAVRAILQEMKALGALCGAHITVISNLHNVPDAVMVYPSEAYENIRKQILTEALGKDLKFLPPALPRPVARTKVSIKLPKNTKDPMAAVSAAQDKLAEDPYLKGIMERGTPAAKKAAVKRPVPVRVQKEQAVKTPIADTIKAEQISNTKKMQEAAKDAIERLTPAAREVRAAVGKASVRMVSGLKEVSALATASAKRTKALLK